MIDEIESAHAEFLVRVRSPGSWAMQPNSPGVQAFFSWVNPYVNGGQYELVGIADIRPNKTEYRWGADEAKAYLESIRNKPPPGDTVEVFKRKAIS